MTIDTVRNLALKLEEVEELPHFEKTSFRIRKKIFATLDAKSKIICLKLSLVDQSVFSSYDRHNIYPVENSWGKKGWTNFNLKDLRTDLLSDAITLAYCEVAPQILKEKYKR